jgi:glycosyltransferase involved in cell wall biosynthesis
MRVLLCNWKDMKHPAAGGAEVYTHEVLRRWAAAGHEVTQFSAAVDGRPESEEMDGVRIVRGGSRLGVYWSARRFVARQPRGTFDVVIDEVNTRPFGVARDPGAPGVALIHQVAREMWFHELPLPLAAVGRYVLEPAWLRAYRDVPVLTVSESSRASLYEYGLRQVSVVPVGVDVDPRSDAPVKEERPTVLFVGRLVASKRIDHALAAFAKLRARMPDAQLRVVGTGPLEKRLRAIAGAGVVFHGRVSADEKLDLMGRAHVLVVTSVREGWGLVVDEAAAMGTPSIGYDVPGLRDSVPAAGGTLVAPTPDALAGGLAQRLPELVAAEPRAGWRGGARPWDDVAAAVLDAVLARVERAPAAAPARPADGAAGAGASTPTSPRPAQRAFGGTSGGRR